MDGARKRKVELSHQQTFDILNKLAAVRPPMNALLNIRLTGAAFHASKEMLRICEERWPQMTTWIKNENENLELTP